MRNFIADTLNGVAHICLLALIIGVPAGALWLVFTFPKALVPIAIIWLFWSLGKSLSSYDDDFFKWIRRKRDD